MQQVIQPEDIKKKEASSDPGFRIISGPVCLLCICVCVSIHHNKGTFGQKDCTMGERGRYVNAQAFSFLGHYHFEFDTYM